MSELVISSERLEFTCPICLEILHRPRMLPCSHTFCLLCLQKHANTSNRKFSNLKKRLLCPACRGPAEIPSNGVYGFPRSASLEKSLQRLEGADVGVSFSTCCICCKVEALSHCAHCKMLICDQCGPQHAENFAKEAFLLKEKLRDLQASLKTTQESDERHMGHLEQRVRQAVEGRVNALNQKRDELCQKLHLMEAKQRERGLRLSGEIQKLVSAHEAVQANQQDWKCAGNLYEQMSRLAATPLDTKNATRGQLPERLRKLSFNREENKDKPLNTNPQTQMDTRTRYRLKRSYSKNKWDRKICGRPAGIAISPWTSNLYVTSSDACKVYIYDSFGKQVGTIGSRGHKEGHFLCPVGIAFSEVTNELYVADKWKHCIYVFDAEGNYLRQIGRKGKGLAEFFSPEGLATDGKGNIYVADTCNDRVQVLDGEGVFLREIGSVNTEDIGPVHQYTRREFKEPTGVSATMDGSTVYVADSGNHRIKVFDGKTGARLLTLGTRGNNQSQFESPECVAVDETGFFLVGDSGNGRVQVFKQDGTFIRYLGSRVTSERGEFGWVSALQVSKEGKIVVTDFKNNLIAFY